MTEPTVNVAWGAEVNGMGGVVVFAPTRNKARFAAVHSYWEVMGRNGWPSVSVWRRPEFDKSSLASTAGRRAFCEDYVKDMP